MLVDTRIYQDLQRLFGFLNDLDTRTDKRYTIDVGHVAAQLNELNKKLVIEIGFRNQLQTYKTNGFRVDEAINKRYMNAATMTSEITQIISNCKNLQAIANQYNAVVAQVPEQLRNQMQPLLKDPYHYLEAVSVWSKIKESLG